MHITRAIHKKKVKAISLGLGYRVEMMKKFLGHPLKHIKGK